MAKEKNTGKVLEKNIGKALTSLLGKEAVAFRLHDTKTAAFFVPPAPADFAGVFKGGIPLLLEAKSSDENLSFLGCNVKKYVKPTQYAYHKLWLKMGGVSIFMFHSILTDQVEYWNGEVILEAYRNRWTAQQKNNPQRVHKTAHTAKAITEHLPIFVGRVNPITKEE